MTILFMRASFGKLEHQTMTLKPGLNIVQAPNEWGKSTWCAFLIAMLYGIDTKSKSSKTQLADKERYAPWSGVPMEGSMDLIWKGRHITIQRSSKGRIPMGEFHAFETDSGLEVPELTAENCAQQLLGVEREVFTRSGFLRFSDLPVTDQEQLRSRLNALVTTGDEGGSGERLEQKLKDLKNRCRYNRSGLLPQAYQEKQQLEEHIRLHQSLLEQDEKLSNRIKELETHLTQLENHKTALLFQNAQPDPEQLQQSQEAYLQARNQLEELEAQCRQYPSQEESYCHIQSLTQLQQTMDSIEMESAMMPPVASPPEPPAGFEHCNPQDAILQAEAHQKEFTSLNTSSSFPFFPVLLCLSVTLLLSTALLFIKHSSWLYIPMIGGIVGLVAGVITLCIRRKTLSRNRARQLSLTRKYGSSDPEQWLSDARDYADAWTAYQRRQDACTRLRGDLDSRKQSALKEAMLATHSKGLRVALDDWRNIWSLWDALGDAQRQLLQKEKQLNALQATQRNTPPETPDPLTFTLEETNRLLSDVNHELRQLHARRGQCRGQLQTMDSEQKLIQQKQLLEHRIQKLEQTYQALDYAQKALAEAFRQLQQRFAPRITKATRKLFAQLTGGRYDRVQISQDLSLETAAHNEDVLRSHRWRSDGTVDQLYLALRLAVAEELIPEGPLVLDDALVRFDDQRLKAALEVLKNLANQHQVILFTCQSREQQLLNENSTPVPLQTLCTPPAKQS